MADEGIIVPTADEICAEGFRRVAGRVPTPTELNRAVTVWFEEVICDIWEFGTHQDITRFRSLQNSSVAVLTRGRRRYSWPEDFHRPIAVSLLEGDLAGVFAEDTTDGGVVLYAENTGELLDYFDADDADYSRSGNYVVVTSGPGEGAMREILYVEKVGTDWKFTIDAPWLNTELPVAGNTFSVVTEVGRWQDEDMVQEQDRWWTVAGTGTPVSFNNFDQTLELNVAPGDGVYAVVMRYWANPLKIRKDSEVMQSICTNWRNALTKGLMKIAAFEFDDDRLKAIKEEYNAALVSLVEHEYDYGPEFQGFRAR